MKTSLIALALAAALPFAASAAEGLSYNYAEADYAKTDIDGGKADGWGVKGSWAFHQNFHVFGDFDRQEIDHTNARFVARAAYQKLDLRYADLDFNGYSAEAGIRTAFGQHAEVYALAGYEDFDKKHGVEPLDGGQFYGRLGGQVKLNQNWGINGDIKMNRHGDKEWTVGPRFSW
jgi:hypothetical protein